MPGHAELIPVPWQMGILPDVRVLPGNVWGTGFQSKEQAIETLVSGPPEPGLEGDRLRRLGSEHFDTLFVERDGAWVRRSTAAARSVLIMWEL